MHLQNYRLWSLTLALTFLVFIFTGVKQFTVWSQVYGGFFAFEDRIYPPSLTVPPDFDEYGQLGTQRGPLDEIAHWPRLSLMAPIWYIGKLSPGEPNVPAFMDRVFSIEVVLILFVASLLLAQVVGRSDLEPMIFAFFLILSLGMNGRMSFSFLGASGLLWIESNRQKIPSSPFLFSFLLFLSLWSSSVSSGVFSIVYVATGFLLWMLTRQHGFRPLLGMWAILVLSLPWFLAGITKNLAFYGGFDLFAVYRMLEHGLGKFLKSIWLVPAIVVVVVAWFTRDRFLRKLLPKRYSVFWLVFFLLGAAGGLFGKSTMTVVIPPLICLAINKISELVPLFRPKLKSS